MGFLSSLQMVKTGLALYAFSNAKVIFAVTPARLYASGRHTHIITSLPCISVSVTNTKFARGVL